MKRLATSLLVLLAVLPASPYAAGDGLRQLIEWVAREGETYQPTTHRRYVLPAALARALGLGGEDVLIRQKAVISPAEKEVVNILQVTEDARREAVVSRREHLGGRWLFWRLAPDASVAATAVLQPDGSVDVPAEAFAASFEAALGALRASAAAAGPRRAE